MDISKIRRLCKEKGISINALESATGIGRGNISRWDKYIPGTDKVKAVADYLGVSVDYLLSDEEEYDEKEAAMEKLFGTPGMRMLFSATKGASEEDLMLAAQIIETLKNRSK